MSVWNRKLPPPEPSLVETLTEITKRLESENKALRVENASLKSALGGDPSVAENAEIDRLREALGDAYDRLQAAGLSINKVTDTLWGLCGRPGIKFDFTIKAGGDICTLSVLVVPDRLEEVTAALTKHNFRLTNGPISIGDRVACAFTAIRGS